MRRHNPVYFEMHYGTEVYARYVVAKCAFVSAPLNIFYVRVIKREGRTGEVGILFQASPSHPALRGWLILPAGSMLNSQA